MTSIPQTTPPMTTPAQPAQPGAPTTSPILAEAGVTGLRQFAGYVDEEFHKDLRGPKAAKVFREMGDNHPLIGAANLTFQLLARRAEYWVDASGETPEHERQKQFIDEAIEDMEGGIVGYLSEALSFPQFGWAWLEKVFKRRTGADPRPEYKSKYSDGLYGWRKIALRAQESLLKWSIADNGDILGMHQQPPQGGMRYIPREKALHLRLFAAKNNPEGRSLYRNAYVSYYFQKQLQFTEAVGIYRNMAGLPDIQIPLELMHPNATPEQKAIRAQYEAMARKMKVDELAGIVRPCEETPEGKKTGYKVGLITTSGKNNAETNPVIMRYRSEIAMTLLSEARLVGEKSGSFALSADKSEVLYMCAEALTDICLDALNDDAIPELLMLNGMDPTFAPRVKRGALSKPNLAELGAYLAAIFGAGVARPSEEIERRALEVADMPVPDVTPELEHADAEALPAAPPVSIAVPPEQVVTDPAAVTMPAPTLPQPAATDNVQQQALNGAQVTSLKDIVLSVAAGDLPRDSGIAMITAAFPLSTDQAERIMGTIGQGFVPPPKPTPPTPPAPPAPSSAPDSRIPEATPKPFVP